MRGGDAVSHRRSREIGENFEDLIDHWHIAAGFRGALAHVVHNAPPSKFVRGKLIYEKAGVADYTGVLHGGGYLAAEAKSVKPGGRLDKSRITDLQLAHLDATLSAGGNSLAFLLVEFRADNSMNHRRYAIPWEQVPWKIVRTAESLDERDISVTYQVPKGVDYLVPYHRGSNRRYILSSKVKHVYPRK